MAKMAELEMHHNFTMKVSYFLIDFDGVDWIHSNVMNVMNIRLKTLIKVACKSIYTP